MKELKKVIRPLVAVRQPKWSDTHVTEVPKEKMLTKGYLKNSDGNFLHLVKTKTIQRQEVQKSEE